MSEERKLSEIAKSLAEEIGDGVLATLDEEGYPYTSLVEVIFDGDRNFWLLLSDLAVHSANIARDARASLLLREPAKAGQHAPATERASFLGRLEQEDRCAQEIVEAYLAHHPQAQKYVEFSDFSFYRLHIERVRLVAGFGRIGWIDVEKW